MTNKSRIDIIKDTVKDYKTILLHNFDRYKNVRIIYAIHNGVTLLEYHVTDMDILFSGEFSSLPQLPDKTKYTLNDVFLWQKYLSMMEESKYDLEFSCEYVSRGTWHTKVSLSDINTGEKYFLDKENALDKISEYKEALQFICHNRCQK